MQKNTKEWLQYGSAIAMLLSGIVLTYIDYFISHDIHDNVLWYVAQCLIYAGSVFGVAMVIATKFGEMRNYINDRLHDDNNHRSHEKS
jgi:Na+/melibiose symporter-like transporter